MPEQDNQDPHACPECNTITCRWTHRGAERFCFCEDLPLDQVCENCWDNARHVNAYVTAVIDVASRGLAEVVEKLSEPEPAWPEPEPPASAPAPPPDPYSDHACGHACDPKMVARGEAVCQRCRLNPALL